MRLIRPSSTLVAMTFLSCTRQDRVPAVAMGSGASIPSEVRATGDIQVWGSLRSLMHEGKTEARVALKDVAPGPHAYAVGAVSGLRGEVTILDDDIIVSLGEAGGTVRTAFFPPPHAATIGSKARIESRGSSRRSIGRSAIVRVALAGDRTLVSRPLTGAPVNFRSGADCSPDLYVCGGLGRPRLEAKAFSCYG